MVFPAGNILAELIAVGFLSIVAVVLLREIAEGTQPARRTAELRRLEEQGLVRKTKKNGFKITPKGQQALREHDE